MKTLADETKNVILIILGIFSAAFGLKGFLLSSRFIDGGVTGISMLVSDITGLPLAVLILVINLPFVIVGLKQIGPKFTAKSALAIIGLSAVLFFVKFTDVTPDKLLTAVFSGRGGVGGSGTSDVDQPILYCVVTRLEIGSVKAIVEEFDPAAFITTHTVTDVQGGLVKRPVLH